MTPVFPNSAMIEVSERLILRGGSRARCRLKVRYGVIRHPRQGLTLIDTGYTREFMSGGGFALRLNRGLLQPRLVDPPETALPQMGHAPEDVKQVIVTHFHADHIAGLAQFPAARIHADGATYAAIQHASAWQNTRHAVYPELLPEDLGARLTPFEAGKPVTRAGLTGQDIFGDGSLITVPLPGHAEGHVGILFDDSLLYATDVQWHLSALDPGRAPGFPATLVAADRKAAAESTRRVAAFQEAGGTVVLAHDPAETPLDWQRSV